MENTPKELVDAVAVALREERHSRWDEHKEVQDWSEGVYTALSVTQADVSDVKKDIKDLTATAAAMNTAIELLKKDHEHADEHWEELKTILHNLQENGCDVYARHRALYTEKVKAEAVKEHEEKAALAVVAPENKTGRTWPDIISRWTPTNIALTAVITLLVLILMYHDRISAIAKAIIGTG